jgi:energy-coupling factor transporter ATP-binding protein EcfA2
MMTASLTCELPKTHRTPDGELSLAVSALHAAFKAAPLPLDLSGVAPLRAECAQVIEQVDDYVLPRLARLDAPALVVVGGPTGAGKSTLVNSLAGRKVTTPGLLRPTTRSPVLVHHPSDREWFGPDRVLPTLDRVDHSTTDQQAIQLVATPTVPRGLAILDAPDFDSIDDRNRELATKLLGAADLWLFVTSAARYSDQLPWQQLSLALERDTAVAVVMNRVPAEDMSTVSPHLTRMLRDKGVGRDRVFFVEQGPVDNKGVLPAPYVAEIRAWLNSLDVDVSARAAAVRQTLGGAIRRAVGMAGRVADAAMLQVEAVSELLTVADQVYGSAADSLRTALSDGTLVRGDLLGQWYELVGRHDVPPLSEMISTLHDSLTRPEPEFQRRVDRLGLALDLALETLVVDHAEQAADRASRALRAASHGSALLDWSSEDLSRPGRGLATRARKAIRARREQVVTLVAEELRGDDAVGELDEAGSRLLAIALVLHAVASPAVDRVSASAADRGACRLVGAAREGVTQTLTALLAEERDRYLQPVLDWNLAPDAPGRLRAAASAVARTLVRHETQGA